MAAAVILQETDNIAKAIQSAPSLKSSHALGFSSKSAPISRPITISTHTPSLIQAQREVIVKITAPSTIASQGGSSGASVRVQTYDIIEHGICTSSMKMTKFEQVKEESYCRIIDHSYH